MFNIDIYVHTPVYFYTLYIAVSITNFGNKCMTHFWFSPFNSSLSVLPSGNCSVSLLHLEKNLQPLDMKKKKKSYRSLLSVLSPGPFLPENWTAAQTHLRPQGRKSFCTAMDRHMRESDLYHFIYFSINHVFFIQQHLNNVEYISLLYLSGKPPFTISCLKSK